MVPDYTLIEFVQEPGYLRLTRQSRKKLNISTRMIHIGQYSVCICSCVCMCTYMCVVGVVHVESLVTSHNSVSTMVLP